MEIRYEDQTINNPNPITRFAHRARHRRSVSVVRTKLQDDMSVLDYGCGQGRFLHDLAVVVQDRGLRGVRLLGYDPFMPSQFDSYTIVSDPADISEVSMDMITCLEVCEHLDENETEEFIKLCTRALKPGGLLLVTVPIMFGPVVLVKEFCRSLLFRRWPDTTAKELFLAAFGKPPTRADNIKLSHRGFDWRITRRRLSAVFELSSIEFSPIPSLGWWGNSQAIMAFRKSL